ncbi:MAG: hypothetical protein ACLP01_25355 [Solirubrobacteraceae bacterium]
MTACTTTTARSARPTVGERVELGRYQTRTGEHRVIYGQRVGTVRVTDVPADGRGRAFLVERELEQDGYAALLALVANYLDRANELGIPPMAAPALL